MRDPALAARRIKGRALEQGFEAVGIAAVAPLEASAHYEAWLAADRHGEMRDKLGTLERGIERELLPGSRALWYSDTGAILERGWAERAGLGWIGKHAGLLSERFGSWFLWAGCCWTGNSPPSPRPPASTAAPAGAASTPVRPERSSPLTSSTPGAASPTSPSNCAARSRSS